MNILFDIGHPAHVHLFKHFIQYLKDRDHTIVVASRDKDITVQLLDAYGIDHVCLSRMKRGAPAMLLELLKRDVSVFNLHRRYGFHVAFGTSVSIAHLSAISSVRSYILEEDDDDIVPLFAKLTYPFATGIIIPQNLRFTKWRKKRTFHNSFHELAYLHPDVFQPDQQLIKSKYGLEPYQYIVVRHSAYQAHHDWKEQGISSEVWQDVEKLISSYPVVRSHEKETRFEIDPLDIHHVLGLAKLILSDSQTMSMEAACLGVPSIRTNSFVGRISVLEEMDRRYELSYGFRPGEESAMVEKIHELLSQKELEAAWALKRRKLLSEKENLTDWLVRFFNAFLNDSI